MLIPRYSIRFLLLLMTASGVFFLVVALAVRGHAWALALSIAVSSVLFTITLHAIVFFFAWSLTWLWRGVWRYKVPTSPFAADANAVGPTDRPT